MPIIPKFDIRDDDFKELRLIGYDKARTMDDNHFDRMVHFFLYNYKFEKVLKNPDEYIEKLIAYKAVLTPYFSKYIQMHKMHKKQQMYNTFRNRWYCAYFAPNDIRVIPTVSGGKSQHLIFALKE